jgi:hypothetical protein
MNDGPEWFAPKRYGYGTGLPITWQGWAVMLGYTIVLIAAAALFRHQPVRLIAALAPVTIAFLVICARTTRGGWRWRWGDQD